MPGIPRLDGQRRSPENVLLQFGSAGAQCFLEGFGAALNLVAVDGDQFRYVAHNRRAAEYTGLSHAQVTGRTLRETYGTEALQPFLPRWTECARTGRAQEYEGYWKPPAGPRWGRVTLTPILDGTGVTRRIMGTVVDISELVQTRRRLDSALTQLIHGFIPICMHCKSIRDGDEWTPVEEFVARRSDASFSHSLCPDCEREHYPEFRGRD